MADDRLIVALDRERAEPAMQIVHALGETVGFFKIGLGLLPDQGLDLVRQLKQELGKRVFLDVKLFDIGATVTRATAGLCATGADFLTVQGDPHIVRAAVDGRGGQLTKLLAVTILTSLDRQDLDDGLIRDGEIGELVALRAERAMSAGADGVICSPLEARRLRRMPQFGSGLIVTPGIRPAARSGGDQKRASDPASAIEGGADHIVVGRPIIDADDPRRAAEEILAALPSAANASL